jgi:hypothetical protein
VHHEWRLEIRVHVDYGGCPIGATRFSIDVSGNPFG